MLLKIGIIAGILIFGGFIFSSEISGLFPSTSSSLIESLQDDVNEISTKASDSVESQFDNSVDKIVDKTNRKISNGITDITESSNEILSNKLNEINPIKIIENLFKNKQTEESLINKEK